MHKRGLICLVLFILCGCIAGQAQTVAVDSLGWMAGCWELNVPQRKMTIAEHWMKPSGGTLIGMSRTVRGEKTTGFEFIRIVTTDAGMDYVDPRLARRSMELMATEVMPRVNAAIGTEKKSAVAA